MTSSFLISCVLWMSTWDALPHPLPITSILGKWKLKSVHHVVYPTDGGPMFSYDAKLTFGSRTFTVTKKHQWIDNLTGEISHYRLAGDSLIINDGKQIYPGRIRELSATRLVVITEPIREEGRYVITETYVR